MHSEIIQMPRKRCLYEVDKIFGEDKQILIVAKTDSTIEFKKGSFWDIATKPKDTDLRGTINFEGDGKTTVNINYERLYLVYYFAIIEIIFVTLGIFEILLPSILKQENLFIIILGIITLVLSVIAPIEQAYFSLKGGQIFADELFLHLLNKSHDEPIE